MDGMTALIVQSFFCWRIYVVSGHASWSTFLFLLTVVQAVAGVVTGVKCAMINDLSRVVEENFVSSAIWLSACSAADTLIAISTTYMLLRRSEFSLREVDFVIRRIVRLTVETNALTAKSWSSDVESAADGHFPEEKLLHIPYIFGKLYSNSLLVMFNNRMALNPSWEEDIDTAQTNLPGLRSASGGDRQFAILLQKATLTQADDVSIGGDSRVMHIV
ncbi:hypothetical protein BDV98DRAFT_226699 [Pterulicium gracile]|uniref:DUF6534 domain-containing protein n=1 Tax=Pterulicium gracile TaxID=1884261 RepID=A0A5C3R430_9AGAR|nr:hypothetical protein BDV98DRAFT_226699 [Pterula gracilis]